MPIPRQCSTCAHLRADVPGYVGCDVCELRPSVEARPYLPVSHPLTQQPIEAPKTLQRHVESARGGDTMVLYVREDAVVPPPRRCDWRTSPAPAVGPERPANANASRARLAAASAEYGARGGRAPRRPRTLPAVRDDALRRRAAGETRAAVALAMGVSRAAVQKWERAAGMEDSRQPRQGADDRSGRAREQAEASQ